MKLNELLKKLRAAKHPKGVLDDHLALDTVTDPKEVRHAFAKIVHPDVFSADSSKALAEEGVALLNAFYALVETKLRAGAGATEHD